MLPAIERTGVSLVVRSGLLRVLSPAGKRTLAVMIVETELETGIQIFARQSTAAAAAIAAENFATRAGLVPRLAGSEVVNVLAFSVEEFEAAALLPDPAPMATLYFEKRIIGDFLKFRRFRGRLGNIQTRVATLNELTLYETRGLLPQLEFHIPALKTGTGRLFPDMAVFQRGGDVPIEFIQFIRRRRLTEETAKLPAIRNAYPGVPIRFVIVGD